MSVTRSLFGNNHSRPTLHGRAFAMLLCSVLGVFLFSQNLFGLGSEREPYAQWLDLSSLTSADRAIAEQLRMEPVPEKNRVTIPRYPMADLLSVNSRIAPRGQATEQCENRLDGLLLVSPSSVEQIEEWYQQKLVGYSAFDTEIGKVFIDGEWEQYNYPEDSALFASVPHVIVSANSNPDVSRLTRGYAAIIEIVYRPTDPCATK